MQVMFLLFIYIGTIEYFNEKHIMKIVDTSIVIDLITYSNITCIIYQKLKSIFLLYIFALHLYGCMSR